MRFGDKLKTLRIERGMSQQEFVNAINERYNRSISKSMISKWENNKEEPSNFRDVSALSLFLGVSADYLIGVSESRHVEVAEKKIPVLGYIAAGMPIFAQENIVEEIFIKESEKVSFALKIKGDSMINARIFDGDIVLIREQKEVESGEMAAVIIDGEHATLKRFYKIDGMIILRSENPLYKDMIFSKKDMKELKIIGKAIKVHFEVV